MGGMLELADDYPRMWEQFSACLGQLQDLFFSPEEPETDEEKAAREEAAKAICSECPAKFDCFIESVMRHEEHGVWGGTTVTERRRFFKPHVKAPIEHGTRMCYERGCRRPECLAAANKAKKPPSADQTFPVVRLSGRHRVKSFRIAGI